MSNRYATTRLVQGADALRAALANMRQEAQTSVITEGVRAAVVPVETAQVALCPVRPDLPKSSRRLKPGEMKASIRSKVVSYPSNAKAVGIIGPGSRAGRVAHLVEFGHLTTSSQKGETIRKGTARAARNGTTHVPPHPFIRPSVQNTLAAQATAFRAGATAAYVASIKSK